MDQKLQFFLLLAPMLLFSMVAHEYAHGYAALKQGDDTAFKLGRLTWNPVKHIDPFFTIILPTLLYFSGGLLFGGAKPVPVNPANYRQYRRGDIIVSLAGIATNLLLAALFIPVAIALGMLGQSLPDARPSFSILQHMFVLGIQVNLLLALFNLLPIPPLDGSHVLQHLLPGKLGVLYRQLARYGFLVLLAVLFLFRGVLTAWLAPMHWMFAWARGVIAPFMLAWPWT